MAPLFEAPPYRAYPLPEADLPQLQAFFEANPEYFLVVNGIAPRPDEARIEFEDRPPPEITYDQAHVLGFRDAAGRLVGTATVLTDLVARGVWHIGLFLIDQPLKGSGAAMKLHEALEHWARAGGAAWLRLGVVEGTPLAERFWAKLGYEEVRRRKGMQIGELTHTVRVLVKPLAGGRLDDYLLLVQRDRPDL